MIAEEVEAALDPSDERLVPAALVVSEATV
jgi:hypothetical protein